MGKSKIPPGPDGLSHGSATTYVKQKCRCELCTAAVQIRYAIKNKNRNAKRQKQAKARIPAQPLIDFIQESPPEVREKYAKMIAAWAQFGVDIWVADRICIELSTHPILVFGQQWIDKAFADAAEEDYVGV